MSVTLLRRFLKNNLGAIMKCVHVTLNDQQRNLRT